jgi:HEAT repeat protein
MEPDLKKDQKLKSQLQALRSGNQTSILSTINELRSEGQISILPEIFDLLLVTEDTQIRNAVSSLLNDLKDKEAVPVLVEAIENPEYQPIRTILLSACWQNGLAYGDYIETFLEVIIHDEYGPAVEAFTVIEEAIGEVENANRQALAARLKSRIGEISTDKHQLIRELVKVIQQYG